MNGNEALFYLNHIKGLGPIQIKKLVEYFSHKPELIFQASWKKIASIEGIKKNIAGKIFDIDRETLQKYYTHIKNLGITFLGYHNKSYPHLLRDIYDPPSLLYMKGAVTLDDKASIAIVGTRKASQYGRECAYSFAKSFAQNGITVVSGLAKGVDIAAHKGALDGGGRTIAVLGGGFCKIYPADHQEYVCHISQNGAVLSEYPPYESSKKEYFPRRNRIISGMTLGTVVIEAAEKSGALITAYLALEQGKEIFALPGSIHAKNSIGTHKLIQSGAKLVTSVDDIIDELYSLQLKVKKQNDLIQSNPIENLSENHQEIFSQLSTIPKSIDDIINTVNISPQQVSSCLLYMEMNGYIEVLPGHRYITSFKK